MFDLQNLDIIPLSGDKKAEKIVKYCKKYNVKQYVETGVYRGATIAEIFKAKKTGKINVSDCYGIELSDFFANKLIDKYKRYTDVHIFHGDTVKQLPVILNKHINTQTLFWLDAHFSGGDTARGKTDCPLLKELEIISKHQIKNHVLLIDDARTFHDKDSKEWPSLKRVYNALQKINAGYKMHIENDIIIAQP